MTQHFRCSQFFRVIVVPFSLVLFLAACSQWTTVEPKEAPTVLSRTTRVTLIDGHEIWLEDATITADSVFGRLRDAPRPDVGLPQGYRMSLEDVLKVEKKDRAISNTAILGIAVGTAAAAVVIGNALIGNQKT